MLINDISNFIFLFKKPSIEIMIAFSTAVILALFKSKVIISWFSKMWDNFLNKNSDKSDKLVGASIKNEDIIHHEIFSYIDYWVYSNIPSMTFTTEFRTVVFKKYLTLYLTSFKDELKRFIETDDYKMMTQPQLKQRLLRLLTDITSKYETNMRLAKLPEVVLDKMRYRNNNSLILTMTLVTSICDSHAYDSENNALKVYTFLNIVNSVLESTINSSEEVCDSINGELRGMSFEGVSEPSKRNV